MSTKNLRTRTRTRKGTVARTRDGRWQPLIALADGTRKRMPPLPPGTTKIRAQDAAAALQARADAEGWVREQPLRVPSRPTRRPADAWVAAWLADRERRGRGHEAESHWRVWLAASLADTHPSEWAPAQLRAVVSELDAAVSERKISSKTARNVWGTLTRMCRDTCRSKVEALRVRDDNPAADVEGPDRGVKRAKVYLYPVEVSQLLSCAEVPLRWRRLIALAVYTGLRAGELRALRWADVDLTHGVIHVHQSDKRGRLGPTKSRTARRVPIEPALLPLLEQLRDEASSALVVNSMPSQRTMARALRRHLRTAGVRRVELHAGTETTKQLTWHDLRTTAATWLALRGDAPLSIQAQLGHTDFATTQGYIAEARTLGDVGQPFGPLPGALVAARVHATAVREGVSARNYSGVDGTRTRHIAENRGKTQVSSPHDNGAHSVTPRNPVAPSGGVHASRTAVVAQLTQQIQAMVAAGDEAGARVLTAALSQLLAAPAGGQPTTDDDDEAAEVVILADRRRQ